MGPQVSEHSEPSRIQARFAAALNSAPVFVYSLNPEGELLMAAGKGFERMGVRPEDVVGFKVTEAFAHDPEVLRELRQVFAGRRRSSIHLAELGLDLESWLTPIFDDTGRLVEVMGISLDVAELRAAQREVAERERFLCAIIDNLPVAVSVRDGQGRYVVVNRMIAERTGKAAADLLGKTLLEVWGEVVAGQVENDRLILESGGSEGSQLVMGQDQDSIHVDVRRSVITLPGGGHGVLTIGEDITQRIRGLAAMEVSAAKSRFFASLSHELRAPLNSVLGFTELLSSSGLGNLTDRQQRYVANIQAGGQHLLALINDLLDLSRLEAGKLDLQLEPVPMAEAAREVVERMAPVAAAKGVELGAGSSRSNCVAWADRRRVEQVLYNLISNAIKFTPAGGSVTVRAGRLRGQAAVSVRDTGVGLSPAELELIFEEFTQLESGVAQGQAGSGLGLSVVRGLVARMGGAVAVRSRVGRGSTFTVLLPPAPGRSRAQT